MLSIVRCPGCGKATFAVGSRNRARPNCSRCGQPLPAEKLAAFDPDTLETRVREMSRTRGQRGLDKPR